MNPIIPAGLTDKNVELFAEDDVLYGTHNGSVMKFKDLPKDVLLSIMLELSHDVEAMRALIKWQALLGYSWSDHETLERYAKCKWGGFDNRPDVLNGNTQEGEYWACGKRDQCPFQGKICKHVKVKYGHLTWKEIEVMKLIADGLQDKQIADQLGLSVNTIPGYKKNIQSKTGDHSKVDMAMTARDLHLRTAL